MKKSLLTLGIALFGFTAVMAQDNNSMNDNTAIEAQDQTGRTSIDKSDLPTAVRNAVTTGKYENMEIKEAYTVSAAQSGQTGANIGSTAYEVHLEANDGKSTVVTLNEQGQIVKSEDGKKSKSGSQNWDEAK